MLYVVKLNALNDSPSLMGIEEHIPDVWKVCRECRSCWYQCSNVIFKVGRRESVSRVPFFLQFDTFRNAACGGRSADKGCLRSVAIGPFQMSANH